MRGSVFSRKGSCQRLIADDVRTGITYSYGSGSDVIDIRLAIHKGRVAQDKVGIFAKGAVRHIDLARGVGVQDDCVRSDSYSGDVMSFHVAFQCTSLSIGITKQGDELHRFRVECSACHVDIRAHGHDTFTPHPAYAQNRDSDITRAELRRGIVGCAQMEGIGTEFAVCPRNFGRGVPFDDIPVFVFFPVLNGGMVHRHIDAADAYALGMGFQRVGFLCVNGDVFSRRDVSGDNIILTVRRIVQRNAYIAVVFHTGKGGSNVQCGDSHTEDIGSVFALVRCVDGDIFRTYGIGNIAAPFRHANSTARDIDIRTAPVDNAGVADTHTAKRAYSDRSHAHLGAVTLLRLQGVDVDVLARNGSAVQGHVRIVVGMDDGVRNVHGCSASCRDTHIFLINVAGVLSRHINISLSCQGSVAANLGMDAQLLGIRRFR